MARRSMTGKVLMVLAGLVAESAAFMYPYKGFGKEFRKYEGSLSQAIYNLRHSGCLELVEIKGEKWLKITPKGRLKLIKKKFLGEWDGFWRIVAFDIEETRKKTRDVFREKLGLLGCQPIQKSVWITPHDISAELEDLMDILDLEDNVDYFISKAVTGEEKYLEMFKITKSV